MDYRTYQNIRSYCLQDLRGYINTTENDKVLRLMQAVAKSLPLAQLTHEVNCAKGVFHCDDLTPRERAAAHMLAVISNHRAITWWREPQTPDGTPPSRPLEPVQLAELEFQTEQAVSKYAVFLPEREAAALLSHVQVMAQTDTEPQAVTVEPAPVVEAPASKTANNMGVKALAYNAEVYRLMTYCWVNRTPGTTPTKGELHKSVYDKMLHGKIKPTYAVHSVSTVQEAAKKWRKAEVVPSHEPPAEPPYVQPAKTGETRHPFKGDR